MSDSKYLPFSSAKLLLTETGLCRAVHLDGVYVPNVASARVVIEPNAVTRLVVEIHVSNVETILVP